MKTTDLLAALRNLNEQSYIIAPDSLAGRICEAANAIGMPARGGAYDPENQTRVIYLDTVNA